MDNPVGYKVLVLVFFSGFLAQFIKFSFYYVKKKKLDLRRLIEPGGMPSSHSSSAMTLSVSIGLIFGFNSILFTITFFFSLVIMYEATGLRRAVGRQAEVLNKIIYLIQDKKKIPDEKLRELLGHTPLEVFLGALMGIMFALAFC